VSTPTVIRPTATISVIIARTVGTIMIRKPSVNNSVPNKLRPVRFADESKQLVVPSDLAAVGLLAFDLSADSRRSVSAECADVCFDRVHYT